MYEAIFMWEISCTKKKVTSGLGQLTRRSEFQHHSSLLMKGGLSRNDFEAWKSSASPLMQHTA